MEKIFKTMACAVIMLSASCSEGTPAFQLPANVYVINKAYDVANGNAVSDMRIEATFSTSVNTADLTEVRLLIVKASVAFTVDLAKATASGNFFAVPISATAVQVLKPINTKDSDGDAVVNGTPYNIYIATLGKGGSSQLSGTMALTLQDKPIYAGDYVGTWEDLGPPGPASFPMSLRIADDYTGKMFYANATFTPYGSGSQDATTAMVVTGTAVSFYINQYIAGYSGNNHVSNCPASKTINGTFVDDVNLVLETFNWADCDGTRDVKLKFKRR